MGRMAALLARTRGALKIWRDYRRHCRAIRQQQRKDTTWKKDNS